MVASCGLCFPVVVYSYHICVCLARVDWCDILMRINKALEKLVN